MVGISTLELYDAHSRKTGYEPILGTEHKFYVDTSAF